MKVFSSIVSFCNIQYQMYLNKILVRNWHKIISPNKLFLLSHAEKSAALSSLYLSHADKNICIRCIVLHRRVFYSLSEIVQVISHPKLIVFHNRSRRLPLFDQSSFYMFKAEADLYFVFIIL